MGESRLDKSDVIRELLDSLSIEDTERARQLIQDRYPHVPVDRASRTFSEIECMRVFKRDGFIDLYSHDRQRLVFPGTLRLISILLPKEFPFQAHWKMGDCHIAYWELFPTVDHVQPIARGGPNVESNWVTTSQLRNSAKANWTLDELGWKRHQAGDFEEWDGLTGWFVEFVDAHRELLQQHNYVKVWYRAARICLGS